MGCSAGRDRLDTVLKVASRRRSLCRRGGVGEAHRGGAPQRHAARRVPASFHLSTPGPFRVHRMSVRRPLVVRCSGRADPHAAAERARDRVPPKGGVLPPPPAEVSASPRRDERQVVRARAQVGRDRSPAASSFSAEERARNRPHALSWCGEPPLLHSRRSRFHRQSSVCGVVVAALAPRFIDHLPRRSPSARPSPD